MQTFNWKELGAADGFVQHVEEYFFPGMSWDNYGAWLLVPEDAKHYQDVRPMWQYEKIYQEWLKKPKKKVNLGANVGGGTIDVIWGPDIELIETSLADKAALDDAISKIRVWSIGSLPICLDN